MDSGAIKLQFDSSSLISSFGVVHGSAKLVFVAMIIFAQPHVLVVATFKLECSDNIVCKLEATAMGHGSTYRERQSDFGNSPCFEVPIDNSKVISNGNALTARPAFVHCGLTTTHFYATPGTAA